MKNLNLDIIVEMTDEQKEWFASPGVTTLSALMVHSKALVGFPFTEIEAQGVEASLGQIRDAPPYVISDDVGQRRSGWTNWTISDWYKALERIDNNGDKGLLVFLLKWGPRVTRVVQFHIGDMLDRKNLRNKPGRPRVPSYTLSESEFAVAYMSAKVEDLIKGGMNFDDAVAKVAEETNMSENTVANAYGGRRGSTRRVMQRRPKPMKPSKE
jgi:hypothetical protein